MAKKITLGKLTLSWHERNGQWRKSIGYKPDKAGRRRVPAEWYFGAEESAAFMKASRKIEEWEVVVAAWPDAIKTAAMLYPNMDVGMPFWLPDEDALEAAEAEVGAVNAERPENVTLENAKALYYASLRTRLKLMGRQGLKQSTFNTIVANLERALSAERSPKEPIIPLSKFIHTINFADVDALVKYHYRKGGLSERSALNYCRAFQAFLDWMEDQPQFATFRKPRGIDRLFKLGRPEVDPKIPALADVAKLYAACADDAERLYMLLGINCGMYESDISALTPAAVVTHGGETCLWWRREKTSHQNTFYTLHWLFPETAALIEKVRAKPNEHGRLLLDRKGRPLSESRDSYRTKMISRLFPELVKRAAVGGRHITFKSLRKFGAHEVRAQAVGDKDNIARMYLGQAIPGVLRNYVRDEFGPLTSELKAFHARLSAAKVFQTGLPGNSASEVEP